ncbi:MAG TPA: hypothetical protein VMZ30_21325, partial [Pyrinomonadaceae bacterium]|nr:hypothetical protein [Pyrinomonadaceae bacterium]
MLSKWATTGEDNLPPNQLEEQARREDSERAHSFIVKVWLEEVANRGEKTRWRGRITHVPGGERRYLQNLNEVTRFIDSYLRAMGVRPGIRERIKRW